MEKSAQIAAGCVTFSSLGSGMTGAYYHKVASPVPKIFQTETLPTCQAENQEEYSG
jgi:hypothetical protein